VWADMVDSGGVEGLLAALADCLETIDGRARTALDLFYREGEGRYVLVAKRCFLIN